MTAFALLRARLATSPPAYLRKSGSRLAERREAKDSSPPLLAVYRGAVPLHGVWPCFRASPSCETARDAEKKTKNKTKTVGTSKRNPFDFDGGGRAERQVHRDIVASDSGSRFCPRRATRWGDSRESRGDAVKSARPLTWRRTSLTVPGTILCSAPPTRPEIDFSFRCARPLPSTGRGLRRRWQPDVDVPDSCAPA